MFLLDTNIVSFLVKMRATALHRRFRAVERMQVAISAITEAELRYGLALLLPEARLHVILNEFLGNIRVEPWDSPCARAFALIQAKQRRQGRLLSVADTMIAAHAVAHGFVLVTSDGAFRQVEGLRVEDWTVEDGTGQA